MHLTELAGQRIRQARRQAGWTLAELGVATGYSVSHLSEIERGVSPITLALLEDLAAAFCLSPLWFVDLDGAEDEQRRRQWYGKVLAQIRALVPDDVGAG